MSTAGGPGVLAVDLGASSGRVLVGQLDATRGQLTATETHRFANDPVRVRTHFYWDILRLLYEIKQGLLVTRHQGYHDLQSVGIDTWGVDFGLLGRDGELLGNPYHYRDAQTLAIMDEVWQIVPREEIFTRTGIQFMNINTIYQLYALKKAASPLLEQAETLLLIPELIRYFLTGERQSEWTISSTSQLCNPYQQTWDRSLIEQLGIPAHLFLDPVASGTTVGTLLPSVGEELGIPTLPFVAVAEHDTGSAVVAVPAQEQDFAYLISGTWSLIGTELSAPVINQQAAEWNITNEGGIHGTTRLIKNVTGLWLIQECRRAWHHDGQPLSYTDESQLIAQSEPFQSLIDPDHPSFINPLHMPRQIQRYCQETGQRVPQTQGEILRCIVESLALRYRFVLERIERLVQKRFANLYIVGGGIQNTTLCQYTANALARPVWAGPQEATAIGNMLCQYLTSGEITNMAQARHIVRASFPITAYEPEAVAAWEQAYDVFRRITLSA